MFNLLLHLANEKNLEIQPLGEGDLDIIQLGKDGDDILLNLLSQGSKTTNSKKIRRKIKVTEKRTDKRRDSLIDSEKSEKSEKVENSTVKSSDLTITKNRVSKSTFSKNPSPPLIENNK